MSDGKTMTPESLFSMLKPVQESKGYYFNPDHDFTLEVLSQLLEIKSRYGHMACPCRLSTGDREKDKDIICPCEYRAADVKEYDSCYCGLYVSQAVAEGSRRKGVAPERRPLEKILA